MTPRKKTLPNLKKRNLILLAAAAVLLAASCFFLLWEKREAQETYPVHTASEDVCILLETSIREVESITVNPEKGSPYTLHEQEGSLVLENDPEYPIRPEIIDLIISNLEMVRAEKVILENLPSRAALIPYGLNPCQCSVSFIMKDKTEHILALGTQIVGDIPYYYFTFDEDNCVYAGSTDMYQAFSYPFDMLHPVEQPHLNASLISSVRLSGITDFAMEYSDVGWQMTVPYSYPVSLSFSDGYLNNLESLRFTRYICSAQDCEMGEFGFDDPFWTLCVETGDSLLSGLDNENRAVQMEVPGGTDIFIVGNAYDESSRYCLYEDHVYTLSYLFEQSLTRFQIIDALLVNPINYEFYALQKLEVQIGDQHKTYSITLSDKKTGDGGTLTDERGNALYDMHVVTEGVAIDSDLFAAWYNDLRRYAPEGLSDGLNIQDNEMMAEIILSSSLHTRRIIFSRISDEKLLLEIDGNTVFYGSASILELLMNSP